jgi:hypothetical protein
MIVAGRSRRFIARRLRATEIRRPRPLNQRPVTANPCGSHTIAKLQAPTLSGPGDLAAYDRGCIPADLELDHVGDRKPPRDAAEVDE